MTESTNTLVGAHSALHSADFMTCNFSLSGAMASLHAAAQWYHFLYQWPREDRMPIFGNY